MANDASKIVVGAPKVGGYAFHAPIGSTAPTSASTALDAAYEVLGYVSEDGLSRTTDTSTEDLLDWNRDVVRVLVTDKSAEFTLTFIEFNEEVAKAVYGAGNVKATAGGLTVSYDGEALPHEMWSFELKDGDRDGRVWINDGQIISVGDVSYTKDAAVGHEVTIKCFRDADGKFFHQAYDTTTP